MDQAFNDIGGKAMSSEEISELIKSMPDEIKESTVDRYSETFSPNLLCYIGSSFEDEELLSKLVEKGVINMKTANYDYIVIRRRERLINRAYDRFYLRKCKRYRKMTKNCMYMYLGMGYFRLLIEIKGRT